MRYLYFILFIFIFPVYTQASSSKCSQQEQLKAEALSNAVHDWDELYAAYKNLLNCDNGGVAEELSDTIMKLLANKWVSRVSELSTQDEKFKNFILGHINGRKQ